jgi:tyrosine recombinase XerC
MKDPLEAFLNFLKYEKMYSDKTLTAYEKDIRDFLAAGEKQFGNPDFLPEVDRKFFRRWLAELNRKGMAKSSIQRKISAVKSFFRFLNEEGIVQNQVYDLIVAPKKEKRLPDFLSKSQVLEILESVDDGTFEGKRDRAILELLYSTGVRLNELLSIRMKDINIRRKTVKVTGKGSKDRVIPIGSTAIETIKEYMTYRQGLFQQLRIENTPEAIFVTAKGKPLYAMAVQRMVRKQLYEHAGLYKLNPHIFRHSFATHMLDNGADIRAVKDLLGHESLATTQHYTHLSVSKLKKAYEFAHPRSEEDGV